MNNVEVDSSGAGLPAIDSMESDPLSVAHAAQANTIAGAVVLGGDYQIGRASCRERV